MNEWSYYYDGGNIKEIYQKSIHQLNQQAGIRWLNWTHQPVVNEMLKVADFWLQYVDGIYLKNLELIHTAQSQRTNGQLDYSVDSINREKILLNFLQQLRRLADNHERIYAQQRKLSSVVNVPKKILICSSRLLSPILLSNGNAIKRRRQTSTSRNFDSKRLQRQTRSISLAQEQRPHSPLLLQHEYRPEFDELDLNDLEDVREISADSHKMLPASVLINSNSASNNSSFLSGQRNKSRLKGKSPTIRASLYHYFDLVHFQLKLQPNRIDTIRDQVNFVFLNRPADFPAIMWTIGGVSRSRLANQLGPQYTMASLFLLAMMPGTISIFYGDEIGLENVYDSSNNNVSLN